ncbi:MULTISPECIES: transposase [unclassified Streptomyces]|uniref:transposase n=1 Tax=unclassified Streptomyces TaxID=2593676 RepID=UPI0036FBA91C
MGRGDLSDEQWAVVEPLLPGRGVGPAVAGSEEADRRIRSRVRTGAPWRDLPSEYGSWQTVYGWIPQRRRTVRPPRRDSQRPALRPHSRRRGPHEPCGEDGSTPVWFRMSTSTT